MLDRIKTCLTESIQTQIAAAEILPESIARAAAAVVRSLLNGHKILCCGSGVSAASAQRFSAMLIHHGETERPSLPALSLISDPITLMAIINDNLPDEIYAKQVRAFGQAGDVLLVISEHGSTPALIKAVEAAVTRDITIVSLTGDDDGELAGLLGPQDVEIRVPSQSSARIQEVHTVTLNCLCDLVDYRLFKSPDHE